MAFEVDDVEHAGSSLPGVSGSVVQALVALVRAETGDAGVAQTLALAADERSFPVLADSDRWTPLEDAVALFGAGALVTGDGAFALHVGQELLWSEDGGHLAERIRQLGSPEVVFRHVGALVERFEGGTRSVALEVGPGRALVEVVPVGDGGRDARLCELTRGFLGDVSAVFDREPATISEHESAARGARTCRYEVRWEASGPVVDDRTGDESLAGQEDAEQDEHRSWSPALGQTTNSPVASTGEANDSTSSSTTGPAGGPATGYQPAPTHADETTMTDPDGPSARHQDPEQDAPVVGPGRSSEVEDLQEQLTAARMALVAAIADAARWEAEAAREHAGREQAGRDQDGREQAEAADRAEALAEAARSRQEADRLERLIEGASASAPQVFDLDIDALLSEIATRADQSVPFERYLLMVRVGPGLPLELHYRGMGDAEAGEIAADLWNSGNDDERDGRLVLDIASPRRHYGRLATFPGAGSDRAADDDRVLRLFTRYAANVLDVFSVLSDARRSDSTARTILSFSERLSGLTNLAQALQILADTVPEVTGCAQSSVYLWDREASRLVLGAFTTGIAPPDGELGAISPLLSAPGSTTHIHALRPGEDPPLTGDHGEGTEGERPLTVGIDNPLIQRMITSHEAMVLDASTVADPMLRTLMEESGIPAAVVAPLFAAGEFLGIIAANYSKDATTSIIHDSDLHERLSGLADQAATAIQNLELLEKVSHMAWHDALTGLPNRRLFEDRVEQELVRSRRVGEPVCMFFVDLDNFKMVNDTFGHATGDILIQQVGQRLVDTVRSQDTVARVGGDEFAILLPGLVDQLSINQLAERTLDAVHTPFEIFGVPVTTSASVGIAIAPEHGDTYDDLLNRADEAMYRAKDHGRDAFEMFRHTPDPSHPGRRALDDRELHADLVSALDSNEFFLLYQPYIDLQTAEIVGVEALIRWQHPTLGVLDPPRFIPMAEKTDLIIALDNWVLWQACRQLRSWQDHGIEPFRLSVNLASRDLSSPDFYDSVARTLRETDIDPTLLELEITERVVLDEEGPARGNIDRLRQLGVRFTIDNFGSGNSSLDRIGSFPVSTLKIDQSFVQVLGPEDGENSLVSAIIAMADKLGLSCVAEGVETLLQSRLLLQRGCATAQGYYFSPPLPADGIEAMLNSLAPADVPDSFGEQSRGNSTPDDPQA